MKKLRWANRYPNCCHCCGSTGPMLNQFGWCGKCWTSLDDGKRAVAMGLPEIEAHVVTYSLPAQPGAFRRFASSALGTAVGMTGAIGVAHWLGWC